MFIKAPGLIHFANADYFLDMSNYNDIVDMYVSVSVPEGASEDVRKDVERIKEAFGSEIAFLSSTCIFVHGEDSLLTARVMEWTSFQPR